MTQSLRSTRPQTLSELIDALDRIREELFCLQRALERRESSEQEIIDQAIKALSTRPVRS